MDSRLHVFSCQTRQQQENTFSCSSFSSLSVIRCERQRPFLPVVHLWGHSSWRSRDRHVGGSGLSNRPGLWSAWDGENWELHLQRLLINFFFFCLSISLLLLLQIHYVILKDESGDSQFFSIDSRSGAIATRASFDREQKASYLIEVQSQDSSESARPGQQGQPNTGNTHWHKKTGTNLNGKKFPSLSWI